MYKLDTSALHPDLTYQEIHELCFDYYYTREPAGQRALAKRIAEKTGKPAPLLAKLLVKHEYDQAIIDKYEQPKTQAGLQRLTQAQKEYIRDHENLVNAKELAKKYNTTTSSIYRAQRGEFREAHSTRKQENIPQGSFGPLTLEQKREIRDTKQDIPASQLAKEYNTSPQNIYNAKKGNFQDTQPINYRSILSNIPEEELRHYLKEKYDVEI